MVRISNDFVYPNLEVLLFNFSYFDFDLFVSYKMQSLSLKKLSLSSSVYLCVVNSVSCLQMNIESCIDLLSRFTLHDKYLLSIQS